MIIQSSSIEKKNKIVIVSFDLEKEGFMKIQEHGFLNFSSYLFQKPIVNEFKNVNIRIVADKKHASRYDPNKFVIEEKKWNFYSAKFDGILNPTYISMRLEGLLKGSLKDSLIEFALNNHVFNLLPYNNKNDIIKKKMKEIFNLKELNEKTINVNFDSLIKELFESALKEVLEEIISEFFKEKNIDYDKIDQIFFSQVEVDGNQWGLNLSIKNKGQLVVLSTSMLLVEYDTIELLKDINLINQEIEAGIFCLDSKNNNLVYENKLSVNIPILNQQLEEAFLPHLSKMRAFILAIQEKNKSFI